MDRLRALWRKLFPPRLSDDTIAHIVRTTADATKEAHKVAQAFERISNTAIAAGADPLAILLQDVKAATFRRSERGETS